MSAIAAVLSRAGDLAAAREISAIVASMAQRGPDGAGVWTQPGIALGCATLLTLPGEVAGQPVIDRVSGSAIVFDGRLDARDELAGLAGLTALERASLNDAGLLLRAYRERGLSVCERLLGDFAFALWDAPQARLICGRDVLGIRPLFYSVDDGKCVVASELQAVLGDRDGTPNPAMAAEALSGMLTSRDETLFAGVSRVPPGCLLVVDRETFRVTTAATLVAPPPLLYPREEDYFEHFRDLFLRAVRDRLRSTGPVAVMLSGGVDSSSVYAAARLAGNVNAYTVGYDDAAYDETPVARLVVERNGGSLRRVGVAASAYDYSAEVVRFRDLPTNPSGANSTALRARAAADGVRVLLSGVGGDEWFFGNPGRWTDWLLAGKWRLLHAELKSWHEAADPVPWRDLLQLAIHPMVPDTVRRLSGAMRRSRARLPWLTDRFQRETGLFERLRATPPTRGTTYAMSGMIGAVTHGGAGAAREEQDRLAARFGHDERMPYLDRRVIDFALAIPETLRSRPGCPKYITRRAWASRLPDAVIDPPDPADYTLHIVEALERVGGRARLADLAVVELGWVDGAVVREMSDKLFSTAHHSRVHIGHAWPLWNVFAVDEWYRRALSGASFPLGTDDCRGKPLQVDYEHAGRR